jgi:hypothetical protein
MRLLSLYPVRPDLAERQPLEQQQGSVALPLRSVGLELAPL